MKVIRAIAVFAALIITGQANAGIPVIDAGGIAQSVAHALQQAAEAASNLAALEEQIAKAEAQIEQARDQFGELKDMTTGNSRYGTRYNSAELYEYLPTSQTNGAWAEIYQNMDKGTLNGYRNKYGLVSDKPLQQEVFDVRLTNLHTLENAYRVTNMRIENIHNLQELADQAVTPQEKEDIQARLASEQASINNEQSRVETVKDIMARQDELNVQRQNQEFETFLNGEG